MLEFKAKIVSERSKDHLSMVSLIDSSSMCSVEIDYKVLSKVSVERKGGFLETSSSPLSSLNACLVAN